MRNVSIHGMISEELCFAIQRVGHALFRVYVLLAPIHDADESEFEGVDATCQDVEGVGSCIH